ncbi:MAG: YihY/virulence factor BrkB family protein [Acidimicrobiia bacterium]
MLDRIKAPSKLIYELLRQAARSYGLDRASRMAAAVAYRTIFALAPLLIISVAVFGLVVGDSEEAQQRLLEAIERVAGSQVAVAVQDLTLSAVESSDVTAVVGFVLFAWTASSLFIEIQNNLNDIFDVPYEQTAGLMGFALKRGLGLVWATGLGLVMVAVWLLNVGWVWFESLFPPGMGWLHWALGWGSILISLTILPLIFALAFRTMTRARVKWRAILLGSLFTSVVFLATASATGAYFSWDADTSAPQIAGAFFVFLLLAYVLSTVFLYGAEVTRVYNDHLEHSPRS